jgi:hypothetical protein
LERLIEETKEDYYRVLHECSVGWHGGTNEVVAWWNYFLSTLRRAYGEFERQVEASDVRGGKGDLVRQAVAAQVGPFTLTELKAQCPSASVQLIKKVLAEMKRDGKVAMTGRGRGARWVVKDGGHRAK